jgi:hypothetical protein
MTATLAQIAALVGWRAREGSAVVSRTAAPSLLVAVCLAYFVSALIVATIPQHAVLAAGPLVLLVAGLAIDARRPSEVRVPRTSHAQSSEIG